MKEFSIEITYRSEKLNTNTDSLSFLPTTDTTIGSNQVDHTFLYQHEMQQRPKWRTPEMFITLQRHEDKLYTPSGHIQFDPNRAHRIMSH